MCPTHARSGDRMLVLNWSYRIPVKNVHRGAQCDCKVHYIPTAFDLHQSRNGARRTSLLGRLRTTIFDICRTRCVWTGTVWPRNDKRQHVCFRLEILLFANSKLPVTSGSAIARLSVGGATQRITPMSVMYITSAGLANPSSRKIGADSFR